MGGAFRVPGNTGPLAEFNTFVDPDATQRVLDADLPLTLIPLDLTEQVALYRHQVLKMKNKGEKGTGAFISKFTRSYMRYHKDTRGFDGGYLHDPLAVGVVIRKDFVRTKGLHVDVETQGTITRGMTVAELRPSLKNRAPNARVAFEVRGEEFLEFFKSRVWS